MRRVRAGIVLLATALVLLAAVAAGCGSAKPADQVTLQLNWYHEAEFVGYYVAQEKGLYAEQDLDVTILGGGPPSPAAREQVLNGSATFAITSFAEQREMLAAGQAVTAVMAAFQIPPLVIFTLAESGISLPADLADKRVGTTTDYWKDVLHETLTAAGVDAATVTVVDVEPDQMTMLYDGSVDAWLGYAQDEPIRAQVAGYPVKTIFPADYGIGGYEGLVIALDGTIAERPSVVERFVRASYEGWRYALEHQDEAAEILTRWAPDNGLEFQKLAVRAVTPLVDTPQVPVGWIVPARWEQLMGEGYDPSRPGYTMQFSPATP